MSNPPPLPQRVGASIDLVGTVYPNGITAIGEIGVSSLMSESELEALKRAGRQAGEYLVSIGKTDMATLSVEEWQRFTSTLILNYEAEMVGAHNGVTA